MVELEEQDSVSLGVAAVEVGRDVSGSVFLREVRGHERSWIWFGEAATTAVVVNGERGGEIGLDNNSGLGGSS
jgi:hypothetical protein